MHMLTVAICTYNGANRLQSLVAALRQQECPISFEILIVDNNSTDDTQRVLRQLSALDGGAPLRFVKETRQGIPYARNRAIEECMASTYMAFIDDDEVPGPQWLQAAVDALDREGAECVGGEIRVRLSAAQRPSWMTEELLGFLGQVQNGPNPFWITDHSTPVWSGNVAYRTSLFADDLRFDQRYNRQRRRIGGGSDGIMFRILLQRKCRIRYRPDMMIEHLIGPEKLRRNYFLRLHFVSGLRYGKYETGEYQRTLMGVAPFMLMQLVRQSCKAIAMFLKGDHRTLRQAMNVTHVMGSIYGRVLRWRRFLTNVTDLTDSDSTD